MSDSVKSELLETMGEITDVIGAATVRRLYIPEPQPHENRHTEFGVLELEDGAAGLYYAWLGESQQGMRERYDPASLVGSSPVQLMERLDSDSDADRSLAMAAINAITASFYRRASYVPQSTTDSMGSLNLGAADHAGMVGYFPSLVDRLRQQRIRLTVIEKKPRYGDAGDDLVTVTDRPGALQDCNKILCTASTLLNDSIDGVLEHCRHAEVMVVVGPTAGFPPDPLFRRNVTALGGTEVLDAVAAIDNLRHDRGLGSTARRYLIRRDDYPGVDTLLTRIKG